MAKRLLALSSGGGHWLQLRRIVPALKGVDVVYASVGAHEELALSKERYYRIPDATRWDRVRLIYMALRVCSLILFLRPDIIISSGAAPGYVALRFGRLLGAHCIWLDSIANVTEVSMSGRKIQRHAHLSLTQWPSLETTDGFEYAGSVLPDVS